jgi:hypothetical protein
MALWHWSNQAKVKGCAVSAITNGFLVLLEMDSHSESGNKQPTKNSDREDSKYGARLKVIACIF